jgi:hypothetical protein
MSKLVRLPGGLDALLTAKVTSFQAKSDALLTRKFGLFIALWISAAIIYLFSATQLFIKF